MAARFGNRRRQWKVEVEVEVEVKVKVEVKDEDEIKVFNSDYTVVALRFTGFYSIELDQRKPSFCTLALFHASVCKHRFH
jgi:hypothetical protein